MELMLWHVTLSYHLQYWYPIWVQVSQMSASSSSGCSTVTDGLGQVAVEMKKEGV